MGVTVPQFEISSGVCSRFNPRVGPLPPFWQIVPSWVDDELCAEKLQEALFALPVVSQHRAHQPTKTVRQFEISSGVCSRFKPQNMPLLPFWQMDQSLPGVVETMVETVRHFKISSGACRIWQMDPSLPGVLHAVAETVPQFEISWGACSRFNPWVGPLLPFWQMDPSLPGVMQAMVVTVRQFNVNSGLFSPLVYADL